MRKTLSILALAAFILPLSAAEGFRYGVRPNTHIFDPAEVLTAQQHREISSPLETVLQTEQLDVFLVILPNIGNTPPEHVARSFASAWCKPDINAIVLHVPGHEESPWIIPGGTLIQILINDVIDETTAAATRRARAEPTTFGLVRTATTEASDALRYWRGGALLRGENIITQRTVQQLDYEKRQRLIKLLGTLGIAFLIPFIITIVWLVFRIKNSGKLYFPTVRKQTRLGAPHAGGNNVTIRFT